MVKSPPQPLRFGLFELDPLSGELRKRGMAVRLTPQARALLCLLLESPIRTRTREEIQQRLWSADTFVDFERGVNKVVHSLRDALGETATNPQFIQTVADVGYRFLPQYVEHNSLPATPRPPAGVEWLAVLPITTEPDAELISLSKRITFCIIRRLSQIQGVRVMAESTLKSYNLEGCSPQQAAQRLGVRAVLSSELTRRDSEFFMWTELVDAADGALLRVAHVESDLQSALHIDEQLAERILDQLQPLGSCAARVKKSLKPLLIEDLRESAS
jgi:DNA-binding winged helix-turn-helix (wHTH) protein